MMKLRECMCGWKRKRVGVRGIFFLLSFELKREGKTPSMAAFKEESHQRSNLLTLHKLSLGYF
jgi:hypothetical protein